MLKIRANSMVDVEKNNRIREKGRATRAKRKSQTARVFEIKFDKSKISKQKSDALQRIFIEGKWFTNHIISKGITDSISYKDYKVKKVSVKVGNKFEERELNVLSSQIKQYMIKRLQGNVKTLRKLGRKGKKIGAIRYRKALHSLPLMQYGITYKINSESKIIHIQGLGDFKAIGLDQIPNNAEFATADLIERNGDYFLHAIVYTSQEEKVRNGKAIGIDLGIKNQMAFSNRIKIHYTVPVSKRTKRLYKVFSKSEYNKETKSRSKRGIRIIRKINKEFSYQNSQKKDINNKLAYYVAENYKYVAYQNDSIRSWSKLYGRRIYQTSIGEFRETLKRKACTPIEIDRFVKTTGVCPFCDKAVKLNLSDREFACPSCGSLLDRDVAAAAKIMKEGLSLWNIGETLAEDSASTSNVLDYIKRIPHVKASIAHEARSSKVADMAEAMSAREG